MRVIIDSDILYDERWALENLPWRFFRYAFPPDGSIPPEAYQKFTELEHVRISAGQEAADARRAYEQVLAYCSDLVLPLVPPEDVDRAVGDVMRKSPAANGNGKLGKMLSLISNHHVVVYGTGLRNALAYVPELNGLSYTPVMNGIEDGKVVLRITDEKKPDIQAYVPGARRATYIGTDARVRDRVRHYVDFAGPHALDAARDVLTQKRWYDLRVGAPFASLRSRAAHALSRTPAR